MTFSPGKPARSLAPASTLMPGTIPASVEKLYKRGAVTPGLTDGLVIKNGATEELSQPIGGQDQFPPDPVGLGGLRNPEFGKTLVTRRVTLVHRQDPFALLRERSDRSGEPPFFPHF